MRGWLRRMQQTLAAIFGDSKATRHYRHTATLSVEEASLSDWETVGKDIKAVLGEGKREG